MPATDNDGRQSINAQTVATPVADVEPVVIGGQQEPIVVASARPRSTRHHSAILAGSVAVLVAAFLLSVKEDKVVSPWGTEMPATCTWRRSTGLDCPGCGMTRCFVCLAQGDLVGAWTYNPAGLLVFLAVAGQIPYRIVQIRRLRRGRPEIRCERFVIVGSSVLVVALVGQWLWRGMGM